METRYPAVAGMFYQGDAWQLKKQVEELFSGVKPADNVCVVSPHAGYEYSGKTAARAIGSLKPAKRFIILGPNHTGMGAEFSIMTKGKWRTPLGDCDIDSALSKQLMECELLEDDFYAHEREHSIEVQLPLLQNRFPHSKFVPVTIMGTRYSDELLKECEELAKVIVKIMKNDDVRLIASSDFSHFIPAEDAKKKDEMAIEKMRNLDPEGFFEILDKTNASVCGYAPITVLLFVAKGLGLRDSRVMGYTTSGEKTGDMDSVVAYSAIGFK